MSSITPAVRLAEADRALRQVLATLDERPGSQQAPADVQALTAAVQHYQQAVLACLSAPPVDVHQLTPAQLLAYRQADPVYRLGYVRGYRRGQAQGQQAAAPVLSAYVQHATLPPPTAAPPADYATLVQQVRRVLATMQQRYGAGPLTSPSVAWPL
jgi:hypothetical protein